MKVIDPHSKDEEGRRGDGIDKKMQRAAAREVAMLQALPRSPNVMQFHGLYASGDLAYMVLEKCGMKLLQCLERMPALTEAAMRPLFKDPRLAIAAVAEFRSQSISHAFASWNLHALTAAPYGGKRALGMGRQLPGSTSIQ